MQCKINGKNVNCKVVENLGYQGGRYAKVVEYEDEEVVVVKQKQGSLWIQHVPSVQIGHGYTGQANTKTDPGSRSRKAGKD